MPRNRWITLLHQLSASATNYAAECIQETQQFPLRMRHYIVDSVNFYRIRPVQLKDEILNGISTAAMQIPESIAFAFIANISPSRGLYSTFFIGLFGGLFTSLPGMVSGIAGGMVAVLSDLTSDNGPLAHLCLSERVEYAFAAMMMCGVIQLLLGITHLTKFIRLVSHSVMAGFANGLSIIIFMAQLKAFQIPMENAKSPASQQSCPPLDYVPPASERWLRLDELQTWLVIIIVMISMAIMLLQTRIPGELRLFRLRISSRVIPPTLTAMVISTLVGNLLYNALGQRIRLIGDIARFSGTLPVSHIPQIPWTDGATWGIILQHGVLLALVGTIESLLTWQLGQKITKTNVSIDLSTWEATSQGIGNVFSSFFSSVGGSVMIGQTVANFNNGSRGRISTTVAAFGVLLVVTVAGPVIELMPIAALTGIMFVVVLRTFEWKTFQYIYRLSIPITDIICIILVTVLAVMTNLAIAVLVGVCWSSLVFAAKSIRYTHVKALPAHTFQISGPVFFGSFDRLHRYFSEQKLPQTTFIDLSQAILCDSSSIDFLKSIQTMLAREGKELVLVGADQCLVNRSRKLAKANADEIIEMHAM